MATIQTTTGSLIKTEFKWILRNFTLDLASKKKGEYFLSSLFHAEDDKEVKWNIELYPHGRDPEDNKNFISLFLCMATSPENRKRISARFSLSIFDENQTDLKKRQLFTDGKVSDQEESVFTSEVKIGHEQIGSKTKILNCNYLAIVCKLEYSNPEAASTCVTNNPSSFTLTQEEQDSNWNGDLGRLLISETGSDICFVINGQEIKAHKLILSARSPVFAAMFTSEMKENQVNRVDIEDVAPDVFKALLHFIYTDRVDLVKIDAKDLLIAANKYLLPLLKFRCQENLSQELTEENCTEMLMLADVHNAVHLKKSATKFIRLHHKTVMKTDLWKDLKISRPYLAVHVFEGLI